VVVKKRQNLVHVVIERPPTQNSQIGLYQLPISFTQSEWLSSTGTADIGILETGNNSKENRLNTLERCKETD
jgi:hypothetical protein